MLPDWPFFPYQLYFPLVWRQHIFLMLYSFQLLILSSSLYLPDYQTSNPAVCPVNSIFTYISNLTTPPLSISTAITLTGFNILSSLLDSAALSQPVSHLLLVFNYTDWCYYFASCHFYAENSRAFNRTLKIQINDSNQTTNSSQTSIIGWMSKCWQFNKTQP